MADIAMERMESDILENKARLDEHENILDTHSSEIQRVRIWALDGNGDSAETRLKLVEKASADLRACVEHAASDEAIERIAQAAVKSVIDNAKHRDRTAVSKVKAFAPYFAAACALVAAVVAAVL